MVGVCPFRADESVKSWLGRGNRSAARISTSTMRRMIRRPLLALLAVVPFSAAGVAFADKAPDGTVRAVPNIAGRASTLVLDASGSTAALKSDETPSKVTLALTRGLAFDGRSVAGRCTDGQASGNSCPANSRAGRGSADFRVTNSTGVTVASGRADIGMFLAPRGAGDIGDVQVVVSAQGMTGSAHGKLVRVARGPFGSELRFPFPMTKGLPMGFKVTVGHLTLSTGARRTVNVKVHRRGHRARTVRRTYTLIRNPSKCPSSHRWPVQLRANYSSGEVVRDADIVCKPR